MINSMNNRYIHTAMLQENLAACTAFSSAIYNCRHLAAAPPGLAVPVRGLQSGGWEQQSRASPEGLVIIYRGSGCRKRVGLVHQAGLCQLLPTGPDQCPVHPIHIVEVLRLYFLAGWRRCGDDFTSEVSVVALKGVVGLSLHTHQHLRVKLLNADGRDRCAQTIVHPAETLFVGEEWHMGHGDALLHPFVHCCSHSRLAPGTPLHGHTRFSCCHSVSHQAIQVEVGPRIIGLASIAINRVGGETPEEFEIRIQVMFKRIMEIQGRTSLAA
mmetsp:Transcript_43987/g.94752  ORF Transcript_43987/g.94752 Transcript_43987/m.94752 type:complete len:270 (-) Transcript_43987:1523-2332(-)